MVSSSIEVAPCATSSSISWSVTARQWHTYTTARLREPNLAVKSADGGHGAAVVGAAVVLLVADPSVMVTFFTVTFFVGGPSPLAGARSEIFWATSRPWVTVPRNA